MGDTSDCDFIVVAAFYKDSETLDPEIDYWVHFDNFGKAHLKYDELLKDPKLCTVSICAVLKSTDYKEFKSGKLTFKR